MYDFKLSGRGDIVLTAPRAFRSGVTFTPGAPGKLLVLSKDRERVVGEFSARGDATVRIALRPDSYWVYLLADEHGRRGWLVHAAPGVTRFSSLRSHPAVGRLAQIVRQRQVLSRGGAVERTLVSTVVRSAPATEEDP